jgi:hypothetical protein
LKASGKSEISATIIEKSYFSPQFIIEFIQPKNNDYEQEETIHDAHHFWHPAFSA